MLCRFILISVFIVPSETGKALGPYVMDALEIKKCPVDDEVLGLGLTLTKEGARTLIGWNYTLPRRMGPAHFHAYINFEREGAFVKVAEMNGSPCRGRIPEFKFLLRAASDNAFDSKCRVNKGSYAFIPGFDPNTVMHVRNRVMHYGRYKIVVKVNTTAEGVVVCTEALMVVRPLKAS